ncbi:MAG: ATP-dependent Clp protease adaptor ClpS [Planctomycetota bacterium]|nr:MAG: ATP-dependent Clp protease adaptor ClpS [Planctomycetota bacterium]
MTGSTVLEPQVIPRTYLAPRYQVVLLDDDEHSYEYVIEMLRKICGVPESTGYELACEVDATGRAAVYTGPRETAELKQDQIHQFGADPRILKCSGSMTAILERVDD